MQQARPRIGSKRLHATRRGNVYRKIAKLHLVVIDDRRRIDWGRHRGNLISLSLSLSLSLSFLHAIRRPWHSLRAGRAQINELLLGCDASR